MAAEVWGHAKGAWVMTKREVIEALNAQVADDDEPIWIGHSWPEAISESYGLFFETELTGDSEDTAVLVRRVVIR